MSTSTHTTDLAQFKIALLGNAGVGKTTWVKRLRTGIFECEYNATLGVEVHVLRFSTEGEKTGHKEVSFQMWDIAGQPKFAQFGSQYLSGSDAAVIMFDVGNADSFSNIAQHIIDFKEACPGKPMCLVGNKVDVKGREVSAVQIQNYLFETQWREDGHKYFDLSAKSNYNFEKPLLALVRSLLDDETVRFVNKAVEIPNVQMTQERIAQLQKEAEEAAALPLPFDEDGDIPLEVALALQVLETRMDNEAVRRRVLQLVQSSKV